MYYMPENNKSASRALAKKPDINELLDIFACAVIHQAKYNHSTDITDRWFPIAKEARLQIIELTR